MEVNEKDKRVLRLREKLTECEARFAKEARKRGFDPSQTENMALSSELATLFNECEAIKSELTEITETKDGARGVQYAE